MPPYKSYLSSSCNKAILAEFICHYILEKETCEVPEGKEIILAGGFKDGKTVMKKTEAGTEELVELYCKQEEADGRMILHAIYEQKTHERVILRCDDTDVLVLLLFYYASKKLNGDVFLHIGHNTRYVNKTRFIAIGVMANSLGDDFCKCLPTLHALTGCDTTSSFFGVGKKIAIKIFKKHQKALQILQTFGTCTVEDACDMARKFILLLYGSDDQIESLDKLRHNIAIKTVKSASKLPPTEDAFKLHVQRCQYQVKVWEKSHAKEPTISSPLEYGWKNTDCVLEPILMTIECAPKAVRDLTHLFCTDKTCENSVKCQCRLAGLECIDLCKCKGSCSNKLSLEENEDFDNSLTEESSCE